MMIKYVFFDLGSTLIYSKDPWGPFFQAGNLMLAEALHHAGIPSSGKSFQEEFGNFLEKFYAGYSPSDTKERSMFSVLREMLESNGYHNIPDSVVRSALEKLYSILNRNWYPEEDALLTLAALHETGHGIGLISNTADDAHVQRLVDSFGFRSLLDDVLTSSSFGIRKPDARIFQAALDHFGASPGEAAMVGDLPEADILGANQMGMFSIWITRRAGGPNPAIVPQATVAALSEIPPLLNSLT
jgi:HAD superfamily hydrolase (TIGR01549 family)